MIKFILIISGLPMSLSSTSNSLKSSATFNSNSSINSTPSVDRYAALKDLDEQLREMKEKETINTQANASTITANPFNSSAQTVTGAAQPNPFQSTASPMHWQNNNNDQQTHKNGLSQQIYPMTNGINGINSANGTNTMYSTSTSFALNGNNLNGNAQQPYQKLSNGFPQINPFAVSEFEYID